MNPINLFGTSEAGIRLQQVLVANSDGVKYQQISPAAEYVSFDRTDGDVQVKLPSIAETIEAAFKSGQQLTPNFMFADVTPLTSANTIEVVAANGDNICREAIITSAVLGFRFELMATPTGWLLVECPSSK